jgi:hypothetical protein
VDQVRPDVRFISIDGKAPTDAPTTYSWAERECCTSSVDALPGWLRDGAEREAFELLSIPFIDELLGVNVDAQSFGYGLVRWGAQGADSEAAE